MGQELIVADRHGVEVDTMHLVPAPTLDIVPGEGRESQVYNLVSSKRVQSVITAPSSKNRIDNLFSSYAPLIMGMPFEILSEIEAIARFNPDYSQAVENVRTLANSGHDLFVQAGSELATKRTKEALEDQAKNVNKNNGGIDGLIDKLLWQASVFGAMCGEWVLDEDLTQVVGFADISPKDIRFFWDQDQEYDGWAPYQKVKGEQAKEAEGRGQKVRNRQYVRLNPITFHYFAIDTAPNNPYGVPPFLAALRPISIQDDMVDNLSQIVKKMGLLGIVDMAVEPLQKSRGETDEQFRTRAASFLNSYAEACEAMVTSGGLVHFNDAIVQTTSITGNAAGATNIFKQNEEQVFSGLKSMPSVQGRCMDPNTRITMADGSCKLLKQVSIGDQILAFDEHTSSSRRRWRIAKVENVWKARKDSVRLTLSDGRTVLASMEHPFLIQKQGVKSPSVDAEKISATCSASAKARWSGEEIPSNLRSSDWKPAGDIREGEWIRAIEEPLVVDYDSDDYKAGYLAGANSGDGCYRDGSNGKYAYWQIGVAFSDDVIIERCLSYARDLGVKENMQQHRITPNPNPQWPNHKPVDMVVLKTTRKNNMSILLDTFRERDSLEYRVGWLAGLFDTDGCYHLTGGNKPSLRFAQNSGLVYDQVVRYVRAIGFECSEKNKVIEILGDRTEKWRFTATIRPALSRKQVSMEGFTVRIFKPVQVMRVERVGKKALIDLTTSAATLLGNGLLTHNSYSTTETYAGVAYDIIIRNTWRYQRAVKRMIEAGYWLMINLSGNRADSIKLEFKPNKSLQRLQNAQSLILEIKAGLQLWASGVLDQNGYAQFLGYPDVKTTFSKPPENQLLGNSSPGGGAGNNTTGDDGGGAPTQPPGAPSSNRMTQIEDRISELEDLLPTDMASFLSPSQQ